MTEIEITSDRGWRPGSRAPYPDERILVLVHRPGRVSVAVFSQRADAGADVVGAAQGVARALRPGA